MYLLPCFRFLVHQDTHTPVVLGRENPQLARPA